METSSSIDSSLTRSRRRSRPRSNKISSNVSHNVYNRTKHHEKLALLLLHMDDPNSFNNMIKVNDMKALNKIIEDIVTIKEALRNTISNNCDRKDAVEFENNVNNGVQNINKYLSKCGEFFYDISNGYLKIMCRSLHMLQRSHCNQMVPLNDILRKTPVVYKLLNLMKTKLHEPRDDSESSFIPTLTGECEMNSCVSKRKNLQCNSDEEAILLTVIRDEIDGSEIYDSVPSLQHNQPHILFYEFVMVYIF